MTKNERLKHCSQCFYGSVRGIDGAPASRSEMESKKDRYTEEQLKDKKYTVKDAFTCAHECLQDQGLEGLDWKTLGFNKDLKEKQISIKERNTICLSIVDTYIDTRLLVNLT